MNHIIVNIEKYEVRAKEILSEISCVINASDRIAIVWGNGVGKTTFMKILTGELADFDGSINNIGSLSLGYLSQIHFDTEDRMVRDDLRLAFREVREAEKSLDDAEIYMAEHPEDMDAIARYTEELDRFQMLGGYEVENRLERVARGIGIFELLERPIREVSGGQRTKIALAKVLLSAPDFLLLDEPTNFIDLQSVEWLEKYLIDTWKGGYMIISHDREFLDKTCDIVYEIVPWNPLQIYHGNYTYSVEQKKKISEKQWKVYDEQQTMMESEKALINRFRAGSRASFAKSRERALEKIEVFVKPYVPPVTNFQFALGERSQEKIFTFKECFIGRTEPLFYIQDLVLSERERVGIIGENGAGKSTFMKTILGLIEPLDGYCQKGKWLEISYYSQMHEELLRDRTLIDNFALQGLHHPRERLSSILSQYGFVFTDLDRKIESFSGGQISKILFAILGQKSSNFLVLDEPTNHLDYEAREALEQSLQTYKWTILFISHDRYFVNKIASKLWIIANNELTVSYGNYSDYQYKKERGLQYDAALFDESAELNLVLESKLGKNEAKRIAEKFWRKKK